MDFYNRVGKKAIGSRLRGLSEMITNDAAKVYHSYMVLIFNPDGGRYFMY